MNNLSKRAKHWNLTLNSIGRRWCFETQYKYIWGRAPIGILSFWCRALLECSELISERGRKKKREGSAGGRGREEGEGEEGRSYWLWSHLAIHWFIIIAVKIGTISALFKMDKLEFCPSDKYVYLSKTVSFNFDFGVCHHTRYSRMYSTELRNWYEEDEIWRFSWWE